MKKLLIVAAGVFVLALFPLGLLGACIVTTGTNFSFQADEQATRDETQALEIAAGQTLRIDLGIGDVRVRAGDGAPGIAARITAWGETKEEAQAALDEAKLEVSTSESGATITLKAKELEKGLFGGRRGPTAKADLEIAVPPGVSLRIESGSGDVQAEGPFRGSKLHSDYGSVRIEDVEGGIEATSSSGDVAVARARGGAVEARSGYGAVRIGGCESDRIEAKSSSGDVRIEDSRADLVKAESGYGDLELARIAGEVEAKTSSGDVQAKSLEGASLVLSTSYGRVHVEGAKGKLRATSSSGDLRISGHQGAVEAKSGYGSVHVEGVLEAVEAESSSGDVSVSGAEGSQVGSGWRIASSYGRGKLELPPGFAFDVDARTNYGKIERGFAVELAPGTDDRSARSIRGRVNGGGGKVEIHCKSGDVIFRPNER